MHGDQDDVVPYSNDLVTLFGLNVEVDGSYIIHQTMLELGNYSELHTYENQGHSPYTDMEFESEFSSDFLYDIVCSAFGGVIGDINQDDIINILDIIILINYILGVESPTDNQFFLSDINEDDIVNILDVVLLVNEILDS